MNIPKLRFPEFKDEWKKRTLKELTKINQGLQIPIKDRFTSKQENSFFYITNEFLKEDSKVKFYIKNPPKNVRCTSKDILMTRTGNTGIVITGVEGAFHNNFFKVDYNEEFLHKYFLYLFLTNTTTQNLILRYAAGSTILDLNHNDFYKIPITFPTLPEQTKIANFLSEIDKRIKLLTDKVSKLEEYKKGAMQKLFSQEVRFKEENGEEFPEWDKMKLGQIYKFKQGVQVPINEQFSTKDNERERFIRIIDLTDSSVKPRYIEKYQYSDIIESNDLFMVRYGSPGLLGVGFKGVIANNLFRLIPKSNKCNSFFFYYILTYFNQRILNLTNTSTMPAINFTSLSVLKLNIPSLPEQTKIANFLSSLDKKIELATKELNKTEEYKRGLLQQMFI